jgi:hypothetical protein
MLKKIYFYLLLIAPAAMNASEGPPWFSQIETDQLDPNSTTLICTCRVVPDDEFKTNLCFYQTVEGLIYAVYNKKLQALGGIKHPPLNQEGFAIDWPKTYKVRLKAFYKTTQLCDKLR